MMTTNNVIKPVVFSEFKWKYREMTLGELYGLMKKLYSMGWESDDYLNSMLQLKD